MYIIQVYDFFSLNYEVSPSHFLYKSSTTLHFYLPRVLLEKPLLLSSIKLGMISLLFMIIMNNVYSNISY